MELDAQTLVPLVLRWLHILAAITAVGGTIFMRTTLVPALETLPDMQRGMLHETIRSRWSRLVAASILFLLVSGFYNFFVITRRFQLPPVYQMLFGIKFLLALRIFGLASVISGRSETAKRMRTKARFWLSLNIAMAVALVCISGVMNTLRTSGEIRLKEKSPPAATESVDA